MNYLLEFYGKECPHCQRMHPLVERLKKEEKIEAEQFEVWHNEENVEKQKEYDKDFCGGVPFFINTRSNQWLCGGVDYEELKKWAKS